MASRARIRGGTVRTVYDDRYRSIFEAIGPLSVERATEVEYDPASGAWIAVHRASGQIIGRGHNRAAVISQEVAWLEERI